MSNRVFRSFVSALVVTALSDLAFAAAWDLGDWQDKTVYAQVNLRVNRTVRKVYRATSANEFDPAATVIPYNTQFKVTSVTGGEAVLESSSVPAPVHIEFDKAVTDQAFEDYLARVLAPQPLFVRARFTAEEQQLIRDGKVAKDMSREALFLAIGFPPKGLNPDVKADTLVYLMPRRQKMTVTFGSDNKVTEVKAGR